MADTMDEVADASWKRLFGRKTREKRQVKFLAMESSSLRHLTILAPYLRAYIERIRLRGGTTRSRALPDSLRQADPVLLAQSTFSKSHRPRHDEWSRGE